MLAGCFLIIGGLLAFCYNSVIEKRRAEREDRRRFEDDIRRLFLKIVKASLPFCQAESLQWSNNQEGDQKLARLRVLLDELTDARFELSIIADNAIVERVFELIDAAESVTNHVEEGGEVIPPTLEAVDHNIHKLVLQMRESPRIVEDMKPLEGM